MSLLTMASYDYVSAEQLAGFDKYKVRRWASSGFSEGGKELLGLRGKETPWAAGRRREVSLKGLESSAAAAQQLLLHAGSNRARSVFLFPRLAGWISLQFPLPLTRMVRRVRLMGIVVHLGPRAAVWNKGGLFLGENLGVLWHKTVFGVSPLAHPRGSFQSRDSELVMIHLWHTFIFSLFYVLPIMLAKKLLLRL